LRDRLAILLAIVTLICLGTAFFFSKGTQFLMPGPLTSAHGAIENCSGCHAKSGSGKLSWLHGLVAGDPLADSKACLTCHKMPETAFNPHGASTQILEQSTRRLTKIAAATPAPQSARAQNVAFPTNDVVARGLPCATCHQEHQGASVKLSKMPNEQCRSCHAVKFDSFDGNHPQFENYPFRRRTPIVYDHAGHSGKHFPEMAKKDPARQVPATCATCHDSRKDRRIMAAAPFDRTCAACHLDQVIGNERVSGPKGIAFLSLPGLDLQTLKKKRAAIGEWPAESEAELSPFVKMIISRSVQGRSLIKSVERLNLQDLAKANDNQIRAVTGLVWEIKGLFYALIRGKASDVLADLSVDGGAKLGTDVIADLTASIPRDVVISAQQQWLPNLASEMANRTGAASAPRQAPSAPDASEATAKLSRQPAGGDQAQGAAGKAESVRPAAQRENEAVSRETSSSPVSEASSGKSEPADKLSQSDTGASPPPGTAGSAQRNQQDCLVAVFGQCLVSKDTDDAAKAGRSNLSAGRGYPGGSDPGGGSRDASSAKPPLAARAGQTEAEKAASPGGAGKRTELAQASSEGGRQTSSAGDRSQAKAGDQTDDLLHPTEEELRAAGLTAKDATSGNGTGSALPSASAPLVRDTPAPRPRTTPAPVNSIESEIDPESWAEYGGWYRQDYAIFYRPTGHKDKFIYSWLSLTGPRARSGDKSPTAAVFELLTRKDAPGSCAKCHSIDDLRGRGRRVNFSPASIESKQGRFTNFIHEPHFGILESRGCLTCHDVEKQRPYLETYKQGNPQNFAASFGSVKKELCQTCHTAGMARQDCLTCHKYHVNGVTTPIMSTRVPTE
jgi:hypothetical protein